MGESRLINIALAYIPDTTTKMGASVLRIILYKNEVYRLRRVNQQIRVLSGIAWVTAAGEDIILAQEEKINIHSSDIVVVSPLGKPPLVLEIQKE